MDVNFHAAIFFLSYCPFSGLALHFYSSLSHGVFWFVWSGNRHRTRGFVERLGIETVHRHSPATDLMYNNHSEFFSTLLTIDLISFFSAERKPHSTAFCFLAFWLSGFVLLLLYHY